MVNSKPLQWIGLFLLSVSLCVCFATVIPRPVIKNDILGVWFGFTPDGNQFYRIALNEHDGLIGTSFISSEPRIYRIDSWGLDTKGMLQMSVLPASTNAYGIRVTGKATGSTLELQFNSENGGWTHELVLYREALLEGQADRIKKRMNNLLGNK